MTNDDAQARDGAAAGRRMADLAVRGIAVARVAIGIGATLAPRLVSRMQFGATSPAQTITVRMLGARDLALGAGALLAARRGPPALRGWVEAGGLADAVDALAFLRGGPDSSRRRALTVLVAGGSAVISAWAARTLADQGIAETGRARPGGAPDRTRQPA